MSKIEKRTITCPKCGRQGEQTVWDSINVGLNPDCRAKVFDESIFGWTCPHCGLKAVAPFTTLYHDMKGKFMIYYFPVREEGQSGFSMGSGHLGVMPGYTNRVCYDLYDFKEKIRVLEDGLDDGALEFLKYVFSHDRRPEELPEDVQYRYVSTEDAVSGKDEGSKIILQCISPSKGNVGVLPLPYGFYETIRSEGVAGKVFDLKPHFPEVSRSVLDKIMSK